MSQDPAPAQAKSVDWAAIEREYRAGQLSNRELGRLHGVSDTAIRKKAKAQLWKRDLVGKIAVEIERKLLEADAGVKPGQTVPDETIVERAAERARDVVLEHRGRLARQKTRLNSLEAAFDATFAEKASVAAFTAAADALRDIIGLTGLIIGLERQAYSLDKGHGPFGADDSAREKLSPDQRAAALRNLRARVNGPEGATP